MMLDMERLLVEVESAAVAARVLAPEVAGDSVSTPHQLNLANFDIEVHKYSQNNT